MKFELKSQNAKLTNINTRHERHGDEEVLAADLKLVANMPATFLDNLSNGLRAALYTTDQDNPDLPIADSQPLTVLRFPQMSPFGWNGEIVNATFTFHGATKKDDMTFVADVNKVHIDPEDGGAVAVTFRVQIMPEAKEVGQMLAYLGMVNKISIAPEPDAEG